jgi:hypothetical protein
MSVSFPIEHDRALRMLAERLEHAEAPAELLDVSFRRTGLRPEDL